MSRALAMTALAVMILGLLGPFVQPGFSGEAPAGRLAAAAR